MSNGIVPFQPCLWQPVLPLVYDESLSYYEQLCKIKYKINEIINILDNLDLNQFKEYTDQEIANLKKYVDNQDQMLYNTINESLEKAKNYTDQEIAKLNNEMIQYINEKMQFIISYIDNADIILKNYIDSEIAKIQQEIDDIAINGIKLYNPTTGEYDNLQNTVYDLYKYLRYYGITAIDFDTLGLTCQAFENKNLTARQFDLYSKQLLMINWCCEMFSPFNGEITPISTIVNQLASLHKQEITAQEFDDLDLTAQAFDNKDLTAYQFDWQGKILLSA